MKKVKMLGSVGVVMVILVSVMFLTPPAKVQAQILPIEGRSYDVSKSLRDTLESFIGKNIYIQLRSGTTYRGFLKAVGKKFIHLEKIANKDYFDALIRIDDISAIEVQFRAPGGEDPYAPKK